MKKIFAAAAIIAAFSFGSCKKCITCTYTGGSVEEYCGADEVKAAEEACDVANALVAGICSCK